MAKPFFHAENSVRKFGGKPEDYQAIHDKMDSSKSAHPGVAHRAIFHSAFGIFLIEELFGTTITNSDGKEVCVRDIAEQHVLEDLGFIPALNEWLSGIEKPWMAGIKKAGIRVVD
jgi:hypothetical protein